MEFDSRIMLFKAQCKESNLKNIFAPFDLLQGNSAVVSRSSAKRLTTGIYIFAMPYTLTGILNLSWKCLQSNLF